MIPNERKIVKEIQKQVDPIEGWCHKEKVDILTRLILTYRPLACFELGVHAGKSLCTIGLALKALGAGHVLGVDSWGGDDEVHDIDPEEQPEHYANWVGRDLTPYKQIAEWAIDKMDLKQFVSLMQSSSDAASEKLPTGQVYDLMHLDASKGRTQTVRFIDLWLPRLKVGGLLVLDDSDWETGRMAQIHCRRQSGYKPYCVELIEVRPMLGSWFSVLERVR